MLPSEINRIRTVLASNPGPLSETAITQTVHEELPLLSHIDVLETVDEIITDIYGYGPLNELLTLDGVTDVVVNGNEHIWFDRGNGFELWDGIGLNEQEVRELAVRLAERNQRRLDDVQPFADVRLKDGIRMHAVIPPINPKGTCISFRIPNQTLLGLKELCELSMFNNQALQILKQIIDAGISFLICGGTGAGKTTLLSAMLRHVAVSQRILIIEDLFELNVGHPHVVNLQVRHPNVEGLGGIPMQSLVRQALRMRPDRLVIGEVRGVEVIDLFTALNTGHQGGCATVHANSAFDVPARIEALGLLANIPQTAIHHLFASAISIIIEVKSLPWVGRKIVGFHSVELEHERVVVKPIINFLNNEIQHNEFEKFMKLISSE